MSIKSPFTITLAITLYTTGVTTSSSICLQVKIDTPFTSEPIKYLVKLNLKLSYFYQNQLVHKHLKETPLLCKSSFFTGNNIILLKK